ncbi:MAG TPA: AmmeMemoRadiSam system radical SAM enzyme, partial [Myxococcaceae bacterium]|nr:AmmeMemoRadiSam system radical SAM enzyme [Myxococcaceae bacterium]
TLEYLHRQTKVWLEITTLLIPGHNDSDDEICALSEWVTEHLGPDVPLHFTAFHPDFKMLHLPPTPAATLKRARRSALEHGLHFVYTGNVHDPEGGTTTCPRCGAQLIVRDWYEIKAYKLTADGGCPVCGERVPGNFDRRAGGFGRRRIPVSIGRA